VAGALTLSADAQDGVAIYVILRNPQGDTRVLDIHYFPCKISN
jgi:hypothetical protein